MDLLTGDTPIAFNMPALADHVMSDAAEEPCQDLVTFEASAAGRVPKLVDVPSPSPTRSDGELRKTPPTAPRAQRIAKTLADSKHAHRHRRDSHSPFAQQYPDYWPSKEAPERQVHDLSFAMADMDVRRDSGGDRRGGYQNNRKRRFREDDDYDRRPQNRRRYEEPVVAKLRRGLLNIGESPLRTAQDEASQLGKSIAENFEDDDVKGGVIDLAIQMCLEQPLKTPFVAATILYANEAKSDVAAETISRAGAMAQQALDEGNWRNLKLLLKLFACLQGMLEGDGVFPLLEELFNAAVDLQTASQEDSLGLELVKIILYTLPYAIASSNGALDGKATEFLGNTDVIASAAHPIEALVEPYHGEIEDKPFAYQSVIGLLQKQLQREAGNGWQLSCIPRPFKPTEHTTNGAQNGAKDGQENGDALEVEMPSPPAKHVFPTITVPSPPNPGPKPLFPETYYSLYADQDVETVPRTDNIASSLVRDALVDTINILDFNRSATAKYLIELDCFWAPETFVKRATPFDKLRDLEGDNSTWKPEDMAVDAVFSQIMTLPTAEHKLVYFHSVITESCKVAPAAIAPSLGRAIRFLFRHVHVMDMELSYRFMDWFAHHLSNFEFRWKWTEWLEDVDRPDLHPKKAFIIAALDKEIRLSFAKRIRETLPEVYHPLIPEGKEKDTPDYKYNDEKTPYAEQGRAIHQLLRKKAPESEIQEVMDQIHALAAEHGVADPLVPSTDGYVTAICYIGSKSLSHVLSCIERCKERLLGLGAQSEDARRQIITSVVEYWKDQPGTAVNIVDKLLNYTILSPESVVGWALGQTDQGLGNGSGLADGWRYEMVAGTVGKVTNRVRQIAAARIQAKTQGGLDEDQVQTIDQTLVRERDSMRSLFSMIEDAVGGVAAGAADGLIEAEGGESLSEDDAELVRGWGGRWARVFRRKGAVEETIVGEMAVAVALAAAPEPQAMEPEMMVNDGEAEGQEGAAERVDGHEPDMDVA